MPISIEPYREQHQPSVSEFNQRLQAGGADPDLVFYRYAAPQWPQLTSSDLYSEYFLAIEGGVVRGGYALKHQQFSFTDGSIRSVGFYHHVLSEGIVNKSYAMVGSLLLRDAMQRKPLLYCLGMGGYDRPLPKMLLRLGWSHALIPFYFRVVHPYRFLREMQALRTSPWRKLLMDLGAATGAAWAAMKLFRSFHKLRAPQVTPFTVQKVTGFSDWTDPLWRQSRNAYAMTAVRDCKTLRLLYPATDSHFTRVRVTRGNTDLGWAVVAERRRDDKFGKMRVGSILDCWASGDHALAVVTAATRTLERSGVDLIVSNQSHESWGRAFEESGFLSSQSNFIFAASKPLAELLQPFEQIKSRIHFTRADGDGLPRNF